MEDTFKAFIMRQDAAGMSGAIERIAPTDLPDGDVLIKVSHSSLNYKDAMALTGTGKIIRSLPMVPGIDSVGTVVATSSDKYSVGDAVILTGWGIGERYWGGYSEYQSAQSQWLVPLPIGMSAIQAMTLGTAGLTAMLCVLALRNAGVVSGKVLVSGATGGVGSVAVVLLRKLGYEVHALTTRILAHEKYLQDLGAHTVVATQQWQQQTVAPLNTQQWDGAVDVVGGAVLAQILSEMRYSATVIAAGLAGDFLLPATVMPFILRGVKLHGVDSVQYPTAKRHAVWQQLADLLVDEYANIQHIVGLRGLMRYAKQMMAGKAHGRIVVDLSI